MVLSAAAAAAPVDPAPPEPKQQHYKSNDSDDGDDDDDDDGESFITNKMIRSVRHRERRRGSKTTDDIREVISRGLVAIKGSGEDVAAQDAPVAAAAAPGSRRGSGAPGLARSKSVKIQRVKFGLVPDAQEGETISHPFFRKFFLLSAFELGTGLFLFAAVYFAVHSPYLLLAHVSATSFFCPNHLIINLAW